MANRTSHNALRCLCEGAIAVALATVLGYLKLFKMPNGGSVTFNMLPIFIFAVRWGAGQGLLAGFVMGLLDFLLGGAEFYGWQSIIGDYLMAYTLCGLAGLFKGKEWGIFAGSVVGAIGRWLVLWITGATVWGEYMPEEFMGLAMTNTWYYSAIYNAFYVALSLALILIVEVAIYAPLKKFFLGKDIRPEKVPEKAE